MSNSFRALCLCALFLWPSTSRASERVTPLPSGTLLFFENCSMIVEKFTKSDISHVAVVIRDRDETWVYEAAPAVVRRMTLQNYYKELSRLNGERGGKRQIKVWVMAPKRRFNLEATSKMKEFLDEQLGRRYSVKGIVRGKKNKGIHCSQLASSTINLTSKLSFEDCHLITPGSLIDDVAPYYPTRRLAELPEHVDMRSSCRKSWDRFKRRLLWCSWSCGEAFSWIW